MSGITGVSGVHAQDPHSSGSNPNHINREISAEIDRMNARFGNGTLSDLQLFDTVEKIAKAIERGDRIASRVLVGALQMILNVRTHFDEKVEAVYQAHVNKIATKLGSALKGPLSEESLPNPWADGRPRTQKNMTGQEIAVRLSSDLTRRGFIDASLSFI